MRKNIILSALGGLLLCSCSHISSQQAIQIVSDILSLQEDISASTTVANEPIQAQNHLEYPLYTKNDNIVEHMGYTTSYNSRTLVPNWVAYELTREETEGCLKRTDAFMPDPAIKGPQASVNDYKNSGYDRGHMAPAADMKWHTQAMQECFYLSNMCPQNHELNAQAWEKVEKMARRIAKQYGTVYIVCGPIFYSDKYETIGSNKVAVPDAFFKAMLIPYNGSYSSIGFIMHNGPSYSPMKEYACTVDEIEELTGMDMFFQLDDEEECEIESTVTWKLWGI